jgi:hypothetical protein
MSIKQGLDSVIVTFALYDKFNTKTMYLCGLIGMYIGTYNAKTMYKRPWNGKKVIKPTLMSDVEKLKPIFFCFNIKIFLASNLTIL